MPLDPQAQALLARLAAAGDRELGAASIEESRARVRRETTEMGPPETVRSIENRQVAGPHGPVPVRIYTPIGPAPRGALVYYHGGGWVIGDLDSHEAICCRLANAAGCLVVSVDYRLAPEHKYPVAVDDAFAATAWVFDQAASLGIEPNRVAVGGDSAGGNLSAAVTLMARDRAAFQPALQVLIYPVTDYNLDTPSYPENAEGYLLTREGMRWCWQQYLAREEDGAEPYASPLRAADFQGLPPALILTAEYDPLRNEGEAYAQRLADAGVPVTLTRYDGMIHAFFRRGNDLDQANTAIKQVADALRRALS
ncbi:MAG: alpha/beta hydrolase [Pirellulales bacterium]|nr:alpha/beta hydrolase [Pirellulales bacterium]